ncbi:MAG TPA: hypothetical protein GX730_05840 [Chloroflexi bacterium]|nr:hypothetical protein [Chloroflexota bacterium]
MRIPVPKWFADSVGFGCGAIIFLWSIIFAINGRNVEQIVAIVILLLFSFVILKSISDWVKDRKRKAFSQNTLENLKHFLLIENQNESKLFLESHPELASNVFQDFLEKIRDQEIINGNIGEALFISERIELLEKFIGPKKTL